MVAEAVGKQAVADPEIMNRAKARFIGGLYQKQENVEAVIAQSAVLLERSPPPQDVNESNSNASPLDSDWASAFM